jgi:hypothetical protein
LITIEAIRPGSPVHGLRAKFDAQLGRMRLRYQVDVGLGDAVYPATQEIVPGGLLDMPMASVRAYTPYTLIAEKLEAMIVLGLANSRVKDYYDLLELPRALELEGPILVESIRRTCDARGTVIPVELEGLTDSYAAQPDRSAQWSAFVRKNQLGVSEATLGEVVATIRRFAVPALNAARGETSFDSYWPPGGPWRP